MALTEAKLKEMQDLALKHFDEAAAELKNKWDQNNDPMKLMNSKYLSVVDTAIQAANAAANIELALKK
jgi:hypothetical protein